MHLGELESAANNAESQMRRFRHGVGDYLAYIDAVVNQIRVEVRVLEAQRSLANARLSVHRALGGAWVDPADADDLAQELRPTHLESE